MQYHDKELYKSELFLRTIEKISQMQDLINFIYKKIEDEETIRSKGDDTDVGYVILNNDIIQKVFQPILDKLDISHVKINYVYIHYCALDGQFSVHSHDKPHAVYYLQIPLNCGHIYFLDFDLDDTVAPIEGKFLLIPEDIPHGISQP